jgi:hypothetical protein
MLINRRIGIGDIISFDYDEPKENGPHRIGQLVRMRRAKKNKLLVYTILDQTAGGKYRQFHYRGMRNIRVTPSRQYQRI